MSRLTFFLVAFLGVGLSLTVNPTRNPLAASYSWVKNLSLAGEGASLQVSDLPAGFAPAPSFIQKLLAQGIASLNRDLTRQGIVIEQVVAFVDLEQAEIVVGLTAHLSSSLAVETFESGLRRPDSPEIFVTGFKKSLSGLGKVKVNQVRELPEAQGIGEIARGFGIDGELESWSVTISAEAIAFRRGRTGALVIAGALAHEIEGIEMRDLALRLDHRLRHAKNPD
jgi:hypothetical protein